MIQVDVYPVWTTLSGYDIPINKLNDALSYFVDGAQYSAAFQNKHWDGRIRLLTKNGRFPTGLWWLVKGIFDSMQLEYRVVPRFKWPERQFDWRLRASPRPRQQEAIETILQRKRGLMELPTRFGKTSMVASGSIAGFAVPTLFIAHQLDLVYDAARTFEQYIEGTGSIGIMGGGRIDYRPLTCACIDTLYNNLKDPKMDFYFKQKVKYVLVDECHMYTRGQYKDVLNEILAPLRLFFSATIDRGDGSILEAMGASGRVIFQLSEDQMIQEGYIADVLIEMRSFDHGLYNETDKGINYKKFYDAFIVQNERRNEMIVQAVKELVDEGRYVLLLISRTDHGKDLSHGRILKEMLAKVGVEDAEFIFGDIAVDERLEAKDAFNRGEFRVLIGSTIADVGLNVPIASGLVLAGAGDSQTRAPQRIGRILCDAEGKLAKAIDIRDENVKFFAKQAQNRMD